MRTSRFLQRRDFLAFSAAALVSRALPVAAQVSRSLVAIYNINTLLATDTNYLALLAGLADAGLNAGRDYDIATFFAAGDAAKLPSLIQATLQIQPAVIIAGGGILPVQTAAQATSTVPIVFTSGVDPVGAGVVETMGRPGRNVTGVYILGRELDPKRVEVLHDLVPGIRAAGVLWNPNGAAPDFDAIKAAADSVSVEFRMAPATSDESLDNAFQQFGLQGVQGIVMASDPVLTGMRPSAVARANARRWPAICESRTFPDAGGFASYGPNVPDVYRLAGSLAGRILKGEKPAELPVQLPTKIELIINGQTAKAIGVMVPGDVIFRADQVIGGPL